MSGRPPGPEHRLTGWRAALIWMVALSVILPIGLAQLFNPAELITLLIFSEVMVSFALVGAIVVTRLPGNPIGWLLWSSGAALAWATAGVAYGTQSAATCGGCLPATVPIALAANSGLITILGAITIFIPLLFPNGRLPSSRWRPVAWLGLTSIAILTAVFALSPGPISDAITIVNPIGIEGFGGQGGPIGIAALAMLGSSMVLAVASVIWRFRQADAVQRQQLRWFGFAALFMIVAVVIGMAGLWDWAWLVMFVGLGLMPLATGLAILRYRLYDLDRLVSRTISYAVVTGGLILVYLAINLGLTAAFESFTSGNSVAVAAATLVVAALFTPVRRRVQRAVDRRFDRARYDAERTTAAFSERLRDEVDIRTVTRELDTTVRRAMAPGGVGIWLREARR